MAHEPLIEGVANSARQMVRGKHFAAADIQSRLDDLHHELSDLKKKTSDRKIKLRDSLEAQKVSFSKYNCNNHFILYNVFTDCLK